MTVAGERELPRRTSTDRAVVERIRAQLRSHPRDVVVAMAILAVVVLAGGILRFWDLGARPFHHDESLHGTFSWYFSEGRGYVHDPLMHGPWQFHATALIFKLFGDGDYQARIMPALFGTAMIAMAWLLRDRIGLAGVVILGVLLTFSPTLLYFSRFIREDIFVAVWTFGLVIAIWRYVDRQQVRYLVIAAAMLALSFATKETTFMTAGLFIIYFNLYAAWQLTEQTCEGEDWTVWSRSAVFVLYVPVAWAIVALWPLVSELRDWLRLRVRTPAMDVLLVLGTLTLPQFAAIIGGRIERFGGWFGEPAPGWFRPNAGLEFFIGIVTNGALATVAGLIVVTAAVGLLWNRRSWALCGLVFYAIYFLLFTTFGWNHHGLSSGIWGSLDYWIEQHDVRRGDQPVFYYTMVLPVYEFLPLLIGLVAAIPLLLKGNAFTRFLLFWFAGMFVALSEAGEKMPWLTVHLALPLAVIAATALGWAVARVRWSELRPRQPRAWGLGLMTLALGALAVLTAFIALRASFDHGANGASPKELLVYTQTSPELVDVFHQVQAYGKETGQGKNVAVYIDSSEGLAWPWAWYFRGYPKVAYSDFTAGFQPPPGSVALIYSTHIVPFDTDPQKWKRVTAYTHRWWFPEIYKGTNRENFLERIKHGDTWELWSGYFFKRDLPTELGRLYGVMYVPANEGQ